MLRRFWNDRRGIFALKTAIMSTVMFGSAALAVDLTYFIHEKGIVDDALDAASMAAARSVIEGKTDDEARAIGEAYFLANLQHIPAERASINLTLPSDNNSNEIVGRANYRADPILAPVAFPDYALNSNIELNSISKVALKNTLEIALVLDNSGSMDYHGRTTEGCPGSSPECDSPNSRLELLKSAATNMVSQLATASKTHSDPNPTSFSIVPFSSTVKVGTGYKSASWIDTRGINPTHHENFDWSKWNSDPKRLLDFRTITIDPSTGEITRTGEGWGTKKGQPMTRMTLLDELMRTSEGITEKVVTGTRNVWIETSPAVRTCTPTYADSPVLSNWTGSKRTTAPGSYSFFGTNYQQFTRDDLEDLINEYVSNVSGSWNVQTIKNQISSSYSWSGITGNLMYNKWSEIVSGLDTRFSVRTAKKSVRTGETCQTKPAEGYWEVQNIVEDVFTPNKAYAWAGCVEARPYPYNLNDAVPTSTNPSTLFVPYFYPDEEGTHWRPTLEVLEPGQSDRAYNSYWDDTFAGDTLLSSTPRGRGRDARKYDQPRPAGQAARKGSGPNEGCRSEAILPLTNVKNDAGETKVLEAIDGMEADGGTDILEGLAWGWRTVSSAEPFSEGRPEIENGNDKVVVLLTDGRNSYYRPQTLGTITGRNGSTKDHAENKSIYGAQGYVGTDAPGASGYSRLFSKRATQGKLDIDNDVYTDVMNEELLDLCENAKKGGIMLITIALDLTYDQSKDDFDKFASNYKSTIVTNKMKAGLDTVPARHLYACASESRFTRNTDGSPRTLFYNSRGGDLEETFRLIADELMNLRFTM